MLLLGSLTFCESVIYVGLGLFNPFFMTIGVTLLYAACFYLNAIGRLTLSRYVLLALLNGGIFVYACMLGPQAGMQYVYFVAVIIPLVIFEANQQISKLFFIGLSFVGFALLHITAFKLFTKIILPTAYQVPFYWLGTAAIACSVIGIFHFYFCLYEATKNTLNQLLKNSLLTQREIEIVSTIIEGLSNKDIGKKLFIEESTVKLHVKHIFKKLNIKKRTELMAFALRV